MKVQESDFGNTARAVRTGVRGHWPRPSPIPPSLTTGSSITRWRFLFRLSGYRTTTHAPVAPAAHRRPRTVGMVSFDVPFARIDAKGLGWTLLDAWTLAVAGLGRSLATGIEKVADEERINALSAASVTPPLRRPPTKEQPVAPVSPRRIASSDSDPSSPPRQASNLLDSARKIRVYKA